MKIQRHLAALLFATSLFAACTKEPEEDIDNGIKSAADCKVSKAFLYGGANNVTIIDTLVYSYTDANITKISASESYITFEYSGGRITRCNYFDSLAATAATDYKTVTYNSDGTVSKIESYKYDHNTPTTEFEDRYEFTYSAGKLVKLAYTLYWDGVASGYTDTHFYTYSGNNITRDSVIKSDPYGIDHGSVYHYMYDDQKNRLNKSGINALFNSALAIYYDVDALPLLLSANNAIGLRNDPDDEVADFSYTTDAKGNLTMMKIFSIPDIEWEYQCP
jgi:hypothetical protein